MADEPAVGIVVKLDDQIAVLEAQAREFGGGGGGRGGGEGSSCETAKWTGDERRFYLVGSGALLCEGDVRYLLQKKL